jgi:hypothetical protein
MRLNYLFNTNAVLVDDEKPDKILSSYTFDFLNEKIVWKERKPGNDVVLEVILRNTNYAGKIEKLFKFASVVVYRNSHVNEFRYAFSSNADVGQIKSEAGIETRFLLRGNESSFSPQMWSMLSFYLEARNSTSSYYKFICLYKIIEIQNLKSSQRNGKTILEEDVSKTSQYIDSEIRFILNSQELTNLQKEVQGSSLKQKNIGEYFKHLYRDAFAHTGFLTKNDYKYGYPTLNPSSFDDYIKYQQVVHWFVELVKKVLKINEPVS